MEIPAVSVIVPLYNAEKYIGDCLDSILGQTLTNFEVIVVDDCSTDSSPAIVESYREKFGGRLMLVKTLRNSGNAGYTARNKGLNFSRGEYVWFVDADDFITRTALEELYTAAKEVDADVVYTGMRYLYSSEKGAQLIPDEMGWSLKEKGIEDKPMLTVNNPEKILRELLKDRGLFWVAWTKFVRRNFLIENEISFFELPSSGDFPWTIELFARTERFLRLPVAVYFWRDDSAISTTRRQRGAEGQVCFWCSVIIGMMNSVKTLTGKTELLKNNPIYVRSALDLLLQQNFNRIIDTRFQISSEKIFEFLWRESQNKGDSDLIIPFFFSLVDYLQKNLIINQQQQNQLPEEVKTHIADLEKRNKYIKAYVAELEKFVGDSQQYIAELEAELSQLKGKA